MEFESKRAKRPGVPGMGRPAFLYLETGKRLLSRRVELQLTRQELGQIIGRPPRTIGRWEQGRDFPGDADRVLLIRALRATANLLFVDVEDERITMRRAGGLTRNTTAKLDLVGFTEIAERLGVEVARVREWQRTRYLPEPAALIATPRSSGFIEVHEWSVVEIWAADEGLTN